MTDKEIDDIYDLFDCCFWADCFEDIDDFFRTLNLNDESIDYLITYLVASLPAKSKLPNRNNLLIELKKRTSDEGMWQGLE